MHCPIKLLPLALGAVLANASVLAADIVVSPNDDAKYRSLQLKNGLKILLISDVDADKAAAALAVHVGSGSDPKDRQGLAHFLEHMLFLGTEKFPQPGEYHEFIRSNGGSQNAYTSYEFTVYFFDIEPNSLEPALERFSQFFVAPLLSSEYVDREINAIESEFRSRIENDVRRRIDAEKEVLNQSHPYTQFQGGNLATLGIETGTPIRQELLNFYQKNYSAGLMSLVVYGKESVDQLQDWVETRFKTIPNTGAAPVMPSVPLFESGRLPARIDVVPKKEQRTLTLSFPVAPVRQNYLAKPLLYVGELLGHEGKGSLLSLLKARGWADSLSSGTGLNHATEAMFTVSIALTQNGLEQVQAITALVFEQIRLIRAEGIRDWAFEEQSKLSALSFRFKQRADPGSYVTDLATKLQLYPENHVLYGPYALESYEPELIGAFLDDLIPENLLLTVTAKGVETDRESRWLNAPYSVNPISQTTIESWKTDTANGELVLPEPNAFIPTDLELKTTNANAQFPQIVEQRDGLTVWHQHDQSFATPRASFFVSIQSEQARKDATSPMLTQMYISIVNDLLNEYSYPATLAGLGYRLYPTAKGMTIRISGYSDKQPELLRRIVAALAQPDIRPARFDILKERTLRSLRNTKLNKPFSQTKGELSRLLLEPSWTADERIAALEPLTVENLRTFVPVLLDKTHVISLSHGNVLQADAIAMTEIVHDALVTNTESAALLESRVVSLRQGARHLRELDIDHDDSALTVYFQGSDRKFKTRANFAVLSQILSSPFFTQLRTEKQLGYVVYAAYESLLEIPGISFVIQSPGTGPDDLEQQTMLFLNEYAQPLKSMSDDAFEAHKAGLVSTLLEKDKTLWERSSRYWYEIDRQQLHFDTSKRLARAVQDIKKPAFQDFFEDALLSDSRKTITVTSAGNNQSGSVVTEDTRQKILDARIFRSKQRYFEHRVTTADSD